MCGIAGILGEPDRAAIERMAASMRSRGPDDSGIYQDDAIVLGHTRLSVIDLSSAGHQPMSRADGRIWIVYNGEIYNYRDLRRELEALGHRFRSHTDTEVILALYEELGTECASRLRGMFAFAIWDRRTEDRCLFLCRDHFGIKPLVYALRHNTFVFASDLPALRQSARVDGEVDRVALVQYLMHGHVVQPRTIMAGVSMLPAGHAMAIRPGAPPRLWRYWDLDYERCAALSAGMTYEDQSLRVRSLLEGAARAQMVSDVPLGAFLSGGVDSTTLVAMMMRVSGRPVHTFSVGFGGTGAALDESSDARRSAEQLGSVHLNVDVTGPEVADALPDVAARLGQPTVDGANMYFVSRAARRGVTVALAGLGGDEIFAGYSSFPDLAAFWGSRGATRRRVAATLAGSGFWRPLPRSRVRRDWELRSYRKDLAHHYMVCHMIRSPSEALRLAGRPSLRGEELFAYTREDDPEVPDIISRISRLETKLYMGSQLLRDTDAASMAHSLEVRVPFLDVDLAEFAYGLPVSSRLDPDEGAPLPRGKRILVQAVRDLIPDWTYRRPKRGFTMPFGEWLRGPLRPLVEDALADRAFRAAGLVEGKESDREWRRLLEDAGAPWTGAWTILMLALWWRQGASAVEARTLHRQAAALPHG